MSQAPARASSRARQITSSAEGKGQPLIMVAGVYAIAAGITALTLGAINTAHIAGSILGATGMIIGLVAQMMSVTRIQRMVIVVGVIASFVGMGLGVAHGGFS